MTVEEKLITKTFYQTLIDENKRDEPIKVLGERYLQEIKNDIPELSDIRFAQGEFYFHNRDFETAIFKWEAVTNSLKPWAQKNLADAHYELNLLAIAEDYYLGIETDSQRLKSEVLLKLFSLYKRLGRLDQAIGTIKKAVLFNPDYANVTELARVFFEDHEEWDHAIELALNEAIRLRSPHWFNVLKEYVQEGYTRKTVPGLFNEALFTLCQVDELLFSKIACALWMSYRDTEFYSIWLTEFNQMLLNVELSRSYNWKGLCALYSETYFNLINGKSLIADFSYLVPDHLTNWMRLSEGLDALVASSATLAWSELFPSQIDEELLKSAETVIKQSQGYENALVDSHQLYTTIKSWAEKEGVSLNDRLDWLIEELLDFESHHLFVAGSSSSGKAELVNKLFTHNLREASESTALILKHDHEPDLQVVLEEAVHHLTDLEHLKQYETNRSLVVYKQPNSFLMRNNLVVIDPPPLNEQRKLRNTVFQYLQLADSVAVVINSQTQEVEKELDTALKMREQSPELPIHFIVWNANRLANPQERLEQVGELELKIESNFPNARIISLSAHDSVENTQSKLSLFIQSLKDGYKAESSRPLKLLYYIKKSIQYLVEKRIEKENAMVDQISWNEEIVSKLNGAYHQIQDMQDHKVRIVKNAYHKVLEDLRQNLLMEIPEVLRNSSEIIQEDSDFSKLHIDLNNEMTKRLTNYMEKTLIPDFEIAISRWLTRCEGEFKASQQDLAEMCGSFNQLFGEEKLDLKCDFKVLEDWQRDVSRLTRRTVPLDKTTIFLRTTPSQLLLKGAGKLFGSITKNNDLLYNKYKQFIENHDYSSIAESISNEFLQPFGFFEGSLEPDVDLFFSDPLEFLKKTIEELEESIKENKELLTQMRVNPEYYQDPLTLFELKHRQYEWMCYSELKAAVSSLDSSSNGLTV